MAVCKSTVVLLLAAAVVPLLVSARLSADVVKSNATASGEDWCQPLTPCNQPKADMASVESAFDFAFGLIPKASSDTEKYEYRSVTPAAAVDWRKVLTNWTVRDQGTCGRVQTDMVLHTCKPRVVSMHVCNAAGSTVLSLLVSAP